jgi:hypothetical protein
MTEGSREASSADGLQAFGGGLWLVPADRSIPSLLAGLRIAGWATRCVRLADAGGRRAVVERFARALDFPAWVGWNLDALEDALRDLSWWPAGTRGRAIVVTGWSAFDRRAPAESRVVLDVFRSGVASFADTEEPLAIVLRA